MSLIFTLQTPYSMITNMERFEAQFPKDYRKDDIAKIMSFILQGKFCQLVSIPGGGKATLLKLLANNQAVRSLHLSEKTEDTYFLYTNLLELPTLTENNIYTFFLLAFNRIQEKKVNTTLLPTDSVVLLQLLKDNIDEISNQKKQTLVLLLDHFDEYQIHLSRSFFQMIRSLKGLAKYRFSAMFATRRNLQEIVDPEILKEFYDFFVDNGIYMSLYDKPATDFMLTQIEKQFGKSLSAEDKDVLIQLTSGHTKLLKVCAESVLQEQTKITLEELIKKPLVRGALFELWHFLTPREQQFLWSKIQLDTRNNEYLEGIGLLKDGKITIPLFTAFIEELASKTKDEHLSFNESTKEIAKGTTVISDLLSPQEFRLLRFCIENPNRILEREEIITAVWKDAKTTIGVTEQALDQLIFRLRHKIEADPNNPIHLQTIKGRGFRFTS